MNLLDDPELVAGEFWRDLAPCDHLVQVYSNEGVLLDSLEGFVAGGIAEDDAVIVIATLAHRQELARRLKARGIDVAAAKASGCYQPLDAQATLAEFMLDGWPNDDRFHALIERLLAQPRREGRRVRAFGEMVALLWADGHKGATVRLEYLWHKLCEVERFSLLCAYPKSGFKKDPVASLHDIFAAHSRVIPG